MPTALVKLAVTEFHFDLGHVYGTSTTQTHATAFMVIGLFYTMMVLVVSLVSLHFTATLCKGGTTKNQKLKELIKFRRKKYFNGDYLQLMKTGMVIYLRDDYTDFPCIDPENKTPCPCFGTQDLSGQWDVGEEKDCIVEELQTELGPGESPLASCCHKGCMCFCCCVYHTTWLNDWQAAVLPACLISHCAKIWLPITNFLCFCKGCPFENPLIFYFTHTFCGDYCLGHSARSSAEARGKIWQMYWNDEQERTNSAVSDAKREFVKIMKMKGNKKSAYLFKRSFKKEDDDDDDDEQKYLEDEHRHYREFSKKDVKTLLGLKEKAKGIEFESLDGTFMVNQKDKKKMMMKEMDLNHIYEIKKKDLPTWASVSSKIQAKFESELSRS